MLHKIGKCTSRSCCRELYLFKTRRQLLFCSPPTAHCGKRQCSSTDATGVLRRVFVELLLGDSGDRGAAARSFHTIEGILRSNPRQRAALRARHTFHRSPEACRERGGLQIMYVPSVAMGAPRQQHPEGKCAASGNRRRPLGDMAARRTHKDGARCCGTYTAGN